jgi:hypothetical protein
LRRYAQVDLLKNERIERKVIRIAALGAISEQPARRAFDLRA